MRIKRLLGFGLIVLVLLICGSVPAKAGTEIIYDEDGNIISYRYSYVYSYYNATYGYQWTYRRNYYRNYVYNYGYSYTTYTYDYDDGSRRGKTYTYGWRNGITTYSGRSEYFYDENHYTYNSTYEYFNENGIYRAYVSDYEYNYITGEYVSNTAVTGYKYKDGALVSRVTEERRLVNGILDSKVITGEEYNAISSAIIRCYTTLATHIDAWGTILEERTLGVKFDHGEIVSEHYETTSQYNDQGILISQVTTGEELDMVAGVETVIGRYTTEATSINGFGTVIKERTEGERYGPGCIVTETYETISQYNSYGYLTSQVTVGEEFDMVAGAETVVGRYTTIATNIDDFGTVREEHIEGEVFGEAQVIIGTYTMDSSYDILGTLTDRSADIQSGLHVEYEIGAWGEIIATHVYDGSGTELPELGGEGEIDPCDIIRQFTGEMLGAPESEILERKAIESQIEQQANDPLYSPQMADPPEQILPLN